MIAGGLEVADVGALLLLAARRNPGAVPVQHDPLRGAEGFRFADEFTVAAGQAGKVLFLGQYLSLKGL